MNSGVYIIRFSGNKVYIGSSVDLVRRIGEHKNRLKSGKSKLIKLQRAFNKYGEDSMTIEILEKCPIDLIREREKYYIDFYDSVNNGYNVSSDTRHCMLGRKHSEHTKKLMSIKALGNIGRKGQKLSFEHIELMRQDRKGRLVGISNNVGDSNAGAKTTCKEAKEIYDSKGIISQSKLAVTYGISQTAVWKIHNKLKWKTIHNE